MWDNLGHTRSGSGLDAVNRWIPDPIRIQNRNTDYAYNKNKAEFNYLAAAPWWACGGSWFHASTAVPSSHPHPFPRFFPLLCQLCFSGFPLPLTVWVLCSNKCSKWVFKYTIILSFMNNKRIGKSRTKLHEWRWYSPSISGGYTVITLRIYWKEAHASFIMWSYLAPFPTPASLHFKQAISATQRKLQ